MGEGDSSLLYSETSAASVCPNSDQSKQETGQRLWRPCVQQKQNSSIGSSV